MAKEVITLLAIHVLGFLGLMLLFTGISGWRALATHYRAKGPFVSDGRWLFLSASMGYRSPNSLGGAQFPLLPFRSALNVSVNRKGIRLTLFPLFRLFHPPLFVPWSDLSIHPSSGLLPGSMEFHFLQEPPVVLRLRKSAVAGILVHAPLRVLQTSSTVSRQ
jgi:hypothetical protein